MTLPVEVGAAGVAEILNVAVRTVHRYNVPAFRALYGFPEPRGYHGQSPWWWDTDIRVWKEGRPGAGAGGGPKPKERTK